jgi:precorrin-2 dehydrogenase / sirohydrochlorin ferrochelatase
MTTTKDSELSGGSLLIAWQLKNKHVLVVGGGDVASGRIESVLVADAHVTLISPSTGLHPLTRKLLDAYSPERITYHDRLFSGAEDLEGIDLVLTALDDVGVSQSIVALCRARKIPVNAADLPTECDFYFGSQVRDGPLQILISTNGQSPKLANLIRRRIEAAVPEHAGEAIMRVGSLRSKLKERAPGVGGEVGKRRMRWMVDVCTSWEMEDLALLDDEMIEKLLERGWEKGTVPSLEEVGGSGKKRRRRRASEAAAHGSNSFTQMVLPTTIGFLAGAAAIFLGSQHLALARK